MPIRMVDDPNQGNDERNDNNRRRPGGGGGGGGGFLGPIIGMLLPMLLRNPKLLLIGGGILVALFFFGGGKKLLTGFSSETPGGFQLGAEMKREEYDKAEVFAALASGRNPLPSKVSLEQFCPKRLNQGSQGSCVAWSSAYAARTILEARATGKNPNDVAFSPSFLYNQIPLDNCQGSYIPWAMEKMQKMGLVAFNRFPYNENSCSRKPDPDLIREASSFKIKGFTRLTKDDSDYGQSSDADYAVDLDAIRQNIAQGAPVIIGMMVGGSFMEPMMGRSDWKPSQGDYQMRGFGGHAMCVIGYDDTRNGGSFQIMNSWGPEWGQDGIGWVNYKDFGYFVKEAYGLHPMGNAGQKVNTFSVRFGLIENASQKNIALVQRGGNLFATRSPIKKGTTFKIEVTNNIECYTYVFGQETDGSSYVLFPYTNKHSPNCGITGTRVFPNQQSLQADEVGNKDFMAVVVTKGPIDVNQLNARINASKKATYQEKVNEALAGQLVPNVVFKPGAVISFDSDPKDKNAVALVIQVDKY